MSLTTTNKGGICITKIPLDRLAKIDFAQCQEPTETLEKFYKRQFAKPTVLINGGFFSMSNGEACFNFIDERDAIQSIEVCQEGMGVIGDSHPVLLSLKDKESKGLRDFISGYPVLLKDGNRTPIVYGYETNYPAARTLLGWNETDMIIAATSEKIRFGECQDIMLAAGATNAINLDGGGSTRKLINGKKVMGSFWSRPVDNVVAFYLKPDIQPTAYRVQVGAFSIKKNADNLKLRIRQLPDPFKVGYKDAYVRYTEGLYKVQVGTFSAEDIAEQVKVDLEEIGLPAYVVE